MRALTVCQPYAHLIMTGEKRVENRTWATKYRGRMYIHAGRSRDWLDAQCIPGATDVRAVYYNGARLAFGAVVGIVTLIDCVNYDDVGKGIHDKAHPWLAADKHSSGPWCWIFAEHPTPVGPWPWKGAQGLFDIHPNSLDRVANRVLGVHEPGDGV